MTIREFKELVSAIPDALDDREIVFYDTTNGIATTPRSDVSQLNAYRDGIQVFTKPLKAS